MRNQGRPFQGSFYQFKVVKLFLVVKTSKIWLIYYSEMEKAKQYLVDCLLLEVTCIVEVITLSLLSPPYTLPLPRHLSYWKQMRHLFCGFQKFILIYTRFLMSKIPRFIISTILLLLFTCSYQYQLRTFKKKYAVLRKHFATAAKLLSEEMTEKLPSKEQELQFIKVNLVECLLL